MKTPLSDVTYIKSISIPPSTNIFSSHCFILTEVLLSGTTFTSTDLLYANLTAELTDAVDKGYFTTTLNSISLELGATVTLRANALEITHSEKDVIYPSSDQSSNNNNTSQGLSPGAVVGLIFGLLAGVCFIGTVIHKQSTEEGSSANKFQQLAPTISPLHTHHSVEDQGASVVGPAAAAGYDDDDDESHTKSPLHHDLLSI
jgi:hypothetical protein